jgi:hypothetical protein
MVRRVVWCATQDSTGAEQTVCPTRCLHRVEHCVLRVLRLQTVLRYVQVARVTSHATLVLFALDLVVLPCLRSLRRDRSGRRLHPR